MFIYDSAYKKVRFVTKMPLLFMLIYGILKLAISLISAVLKLAISLISAVLKIISYIFLSLCKAIDKHFLSIPHYVPPYIIFMTDSGKMRIHTMQTIRYNLKRMNRPVFVPGRTKPPPIPKSYIEKPDFLN